MIIVIKLKHIWTQLFETYRIIYNLPKSNLNLANLKSIILL